jgi:RNA polymerase sigma factor (sigma-70 family)
MTGLMTAVYKYDPVQGNKFSTVAYYWIVQAIGRGTNKTGRLVRLPENRVSDFINISKVRADFEESGLSSSEMNMKVMDETGLTFAEIVDITNAASTPASLNKVVNSGDGSSKELIDYVGQDRASESSEELVMKSELIKILNERLEGMSEVARDVISSSFMMEGLSEKPLTSKVVREKHNLSAPRFKKILGESLVSLRKDLKDIGVEFQDFLD